jgi:5'(3')-deoxyribonucleotidase
MSKIDLMIDMDNTISQTVKCVICEGHYTGVDFRPKYEEIVNPDLFSIYGKNVEYVWPMVFSEDHTFIEPVPCAASSIKTLIESGLYNVSINTARDEVFRDTTEDWLKYYGFEGLKVSFTKSGHKYDNLLNDTIIIEDNIMELKNANGYIGALLFDVPWSKTYAIDNRIKVVKGWMDILDVLLPAYKDFPSYK